MLEAPIPPDEALRLETLRRLSLLDSEAEERFDRLTRMARRVFNVPIALVSLVDEDRQWFKSCIGLEVRETARDISFCGHAIMGNETFIVPDASQDPRFADNPLVVGGPASASMPDSHCGSPTAANLGHSASSIRCRGN